MIAGSDTTSNTFGWIFQYLVEYPDVKARLVEEIDSVLNSTQDVVPSLDQLAQMPYTEAVVKETLRFKVGKNCNVFDCMLKIIADDTTIDRHFTGPRDVSLYRVDQEDRRARRLQRLGAPQGNHHQHSHSIRIRQRGRRVGL